jgi:hypothetical protein
MKTKEYFVKNSIDYFYRGYAPTFKFNDEIIDNGFIATSLSKHVAESFAKKDETFIVTFKTKDLSEDSFFVILDDKIADHLQEQEILFLPGKIYFRYINGQMYGSYKPNELLLSMVGEMKGGDYDENKGTNVVIPNTAFIDLTGKLIVWYRHIKGRHLEGMGFKFMPKDQAKVARFFKYEVMPQEKLLKYMNECIPDYQDLQKKAMSGERLTEEESERYASYDIHMAVLDIDKKVILNTHYGVPKYMMNELGCSKEKNEEEIKVFLLKHFAWLMEDSVNISNK